MENRKQTEQALWKAFEAIRVTSNVKDYPYKILGLIFLKYLSDTFDKIHRTLSLESDKGVDPEDPDEYIALGALYLPEKIRWSFFEKNITSPEIGTIVDNAMRQLQYLKPGWMGKLPDGYAAPGIDPGIISNLIGIISTIDSTTDQDILPGLFEYVLMQFPREKATSSGEFYSPRTVSQLLVESLAPGAGRIYDPNCGSGGMLIEAANYINRHNSNTDNISLYGQEYDTDTVKLTTMNLAIRGIEAAISTGNIFEADRYPELKADYILANPPFNMSWPAEELWNDPRWIYGIAPARNANYAWLQHCLSKLSPKGTAAVILPNGSLSSISGSESEIRRRMIEAGNIECIVTLPSNLFFNTSIPVSVWIISKHRTTDEILFINGAELGRMATKRNRELTPKDITLISSTYHQWKNRDNRYKNTAGFSKSVDLEELSAHSYSLLPSLYVGSAEDEQDTMPFDEKMRRLTQQLSEQFARSNELENIIRQKIKELGYDLR